jgi:signal transduction histidine kinase
VAVQEEERRQLVQTLHDNASPNLAAIQIILNTMQKSLKGEPSPHAIEAAIEDAIALLEDTGLSIREVCSDLRPPLLDYAGLIPALDSYAHQFSQRTGMAVNFNVEGPSSRFSPEVESSLFRITQEALTNCAKHAGAAEVDIDIVVSEGALLLTITDDGNGFSLESLGASGRSPGLGLITMRERTEFIGGRFEIQSRIGMGTRLVVVLQPLQPSPLPLPRRLTFRGAASCDLDASPAQTQAAGGMA